MRARYITIVEVRAVLSATEMWPEQSTFKQFMISAIFAEITEIEYTKWRHPLIGSDNMTHTAQLLGSGTRYNVSVKY